MSSLPITGLYARRGAWETDVVGGGQASASVDAGERKCMKIPLTEVEAQLVEESLMDSLTEQQPSFTSPHLDAEQYRSLRLRVGRLLRSGGTLEVSEDELWTIIHHTSMFEFVGDVAPGLALKIKIYEMLGGDDVR